jgi:hypothetical protein
VERQIISGPALEEIVAHENMVSSLYGGRGVLDPE